MPTAPPDGPARERPDPALGLFETMLVCDGQVQEPAAHLRRLAASVAELYGAELPRGLPIELQRRAAALTGEHRLRVDAIPAPGGLRIGWRTSPLDPGSSAPVRCHEVVLAGGLGPHKWSDRRALDRLAVSDATALIVDHDGAVLEAAWANLWLIEGRKLITPPADGRILPGVTRAQLLELAPELGLVAREESVSTARIRAAEGLFLTSSLRHAVGAGLAGEIAREPEHPVTAAIRAGLRAHGWTVSIS